MRICCARHLVCRTACTTPNSPPCDTGVYDAMQRVIRLGRNSGNSFNFVGEEWASSHRILWVALPETRPTRLFSLKTSGPQSAKPGLISAGKPASVFQGYAGVVAGTVVRRWNGKGGGPRRGPGVLFAGAVSSGQVAGPVAGGTAQMLSGSETDLSDVERYATQFVVLRLRRRLILAVRSVCLMLAPPSPTPSAVSGRLPTCSWLLLRVLLDMLEMLGVWAVLAVLFNQFAVLASSWLEQVVEQLARDGVRSVGKCAGNALRRVRLVLNMSLMC